MLLPVRVRPTPAGVLSAQALNLVSQKYIWKRYLSSPGCLGRKWIHTSSHKLPKSGLLLASLMTARRAPHLPPGYSQKPTEIWRSSEERAGSRIIRKELPQLYQKDRQPNSKLVKDLNRHFSKQEIQIANKAHGKKLDTGQINIA